MNIISNSFIGYNNNKIKPRKQSISFNGYAACPLKSLYLQATEDYKSLETAKEVQQIGLKENFDVFIQVGDKVLPPDKFQFRPKQTLPSDTLCWSQDNKIIAEGTNGEKDTVLINSIEPHIVETAATETFATSMGFPHKKLKSALEGGNCYIGKNNKGESYAIIGKDNLIDTAKKIALDEIHTKVSCYNDLNIKETPYINNEKKYQQKAMLQIAQELNIDPKNICYLSQPDFHIDMEMRPLNYPVVLVNDYNLSIELLKKATDEATDPTVKEQLDELIYYTNSKKKDLASKYTDTDTIVKELESQGFKPVRVPGIFYGGTNFVNAIVNQKTNGDLIYITNKSCWHKFKGNLEGPNLNDLFEKVLKEKVPQIKQVYFVSGPEGKRSNYISDNLNDDQGGGIHCMVSEHPDFDLWRKMLANKK